ncbi:MAG TPA: hypothetical protein VMA95_04725 [Streptosporangiaceae bacterium]|nr:hypothetical protein [Streptosporangiaceae bacterium]
MSTVNELMLSPAGTLFEPLDVEVVEVVEADEHAAATRLTAAARPTQPTTPKRRDVPRPCGREA